MHNDDKVRIISLRHVSCGVTTTVVNLGFARLAYRQPHKKDSRKADTTNTMQKVSQLNVVLASIQLFASHVFRWVDSSSHTDSDEGGPYSVHSPTQP